MTLQTNDKLISLCMITKDEEKVLERCLESVADYVDEIIIIDTGSTDRTKEIAQRYTDHVYDFEWINDFSAARNEGVKRATATWILVLDADEYFDEQGAKTLRQFLSTQTPSDNVVYSVSIINFLGQAIGKGGVLESSADRIFPNHQGIFFHRNIHEQLRSNNPEIELFNAKTPITIYHTGYLDETQTEKKKSERNREIFMSLKGTKLTDYDYYTLGNEFTVSKDLEKAQYYYRRAFKKKHIDKAWYNHCLVGLITVTLQLDQLTDAWKLIESELAPLNHYPEYASIVAAVYDHLGFHDQAEQYYLEAIRISEERAKKEKNFWLISPDYGAKTPFQELTGIYYRRRDIKNTVYYMTKTLLNDPQQINTLLHLLQLLVQTEEANAIISLLEQIYEQPSPLQLAILFKIMLVVGERQLVDHYYELCNAKDIHIAVEDKLKLYMIQDKREKFEAELNSLSAEERLKEDNVFLQMVASLIWERSDVIEALSLPEDHQYVDMHRFILSTLTNEQVDIDELDDKQLHDLISLLTTMFTMQYYEAYDVAVQKLNHPLVINQLANYFYRSNRVDLAVNYYTIMLEQHADHLDGEAYEHLAFLHFNDNFIEDGLPFLEKAIEKNPKLVKLYVYYCLYSQDAEKIQKYKQALAYHFPHYQYLPMIQSL